MNWPVSILSFVNVASLLFILVAILLLAVVLWAAVFLMYIEKLNKTFLRVIPFYAFRGFLFFAGLGIALLIIERMYLHFFPI